MDISPYFTHIDRRVFYIKRRCDLVFYLIREKTTYSALEASKENHIDGVKNEWVDFLTDMNKCIVTANGLKPYLAASTPLNFSQTGIDISTLNFLFFHRKNILINDLLEELIITAEAISKNLRDYERLPFSVWKTHLETTVKDFKLQVNKMKKYEKYR